jgi:acyl-CoA hydrolase
MTEMKTSTFKPVEASLIKMTQLMLPSHSNFSGKIHGGYVLSLMDQIAFACASKHSGNYCVTASVNKVDFLNPIEVGELVTLKASINYTGRTSMLVGLRVESENIQSGEVKHCNSSYFTMVAKNDTGKNVAVPGLILNNSEDVRRFVRGIEIQKNSKRNSASYLKENFDAEAYLSSLTGNNMKLGSELQQV